MINVEQLSGFGEALRELRWNARMKQIEVVRATKMTAPQISRYENGHEMPTVESLVKYLNAVGADFHDLQRVLEAPAEAGRPRPAEETARRRPRPGDEGDRPESSSALRQVVGGLVELNIEGMERLEHRMISLEERLEAYTAAGGQLRKVNPEMLAKIRKRRSARSSESEKE